jgi:hypothetical protein
LPSSINVMRTIGIPLAGGCDARHPVARSLAPAPVEPRQCNGGAVSGFGGGGSGLGGAASGLGGLDLAAVARSHHLVSGPVEPERCPQHCQRWQCPTSPPVHPMPSPIRLPVGNDRYASHPNASSLGELDSRCGACRGCSSSQRNSDIGRYQPDRSSARWAAHTDHREFRNRAFHIRNAEREPFQSDAKLSPTTGLVC